MGPEEIAAAVSADETVEFLQKLVRAVSPNPPGDEREAADAAEAILSGFGLSVERVEPAPNRISLIASFGDASAGPTLLFNGHYDVVPATDVDAWPHPPFDAVVSDGKLYGRGSTDMKAGIAAALSAVSAMSRSGFKPKGRLLLHLVADEEAMGTWGTDWLVKKGYCEGVTEALVGEPTSLGLVTSERGAYWIEIHTDGKSAHGSTPQLGVSAVAHMTHVIQELLSMRIKGLHPVLGGPSINVGTIQGGAKVNSVPDHCVIEVDRRTIPGETREEVLEQISGALSRVKERVPELSARVVEGIWADACETPEGTRIVELITEATRIFHGEPDEFGYGGATDARFLNMAGIPSLIFGPGNIHLAHTTGEYVEVDELVKAARIYAHAFAQFLS